MIRIIALSFCLLALSACSPKTEAQPPAQPVATAPTPTPVPTPDPEKEALKARVAALENEQRAAYAPPTPGPAMIEDTPFRILTSTWFFCADGGRRITGTVRNMSGKSYRAVFIKVGILVGDIQTESVIALVENMQPGAICLFQTDQLERSYASMNNLSVPQPTYRLLGFEAY